MKVEVGDWVRFKRGSRVYEVSETQPAEGDTHFIAVKGSRLLHRAETISDRASKFWIKKADKP